MSIKIYFFFGISHAHGGSKLEDYLIGEGDLLGKKLLEEYQQIEIVELKVLPQKSTTQKRVISFLWFHENKIQRYSRKNG